MPKMTWLEKVLIVLLFIVCLPGSVLSQVESLLRWFGTGTNDTIVEFVPSTFTGDGGNSYGPPFRWNVGTFAGVNPGCPGNHNNTVSTFGWNVNWGGGPIDPAQPTMALHLEKEYCINGKPNVEAHIQHLDTNGVTHRPFSFAAPWDGSGGSSMYLQSDKADLRDYSGHQRVVFNMEAAAGVMELIPKNGQGMSIWQDQNNLPWLRQLNNAGNTFLWLPYFDNNDRLYVSGMVQLGTGVPQADLGSPPNGTLAYCPDCMLTNPCSGGGTGALAKRLNGVWVCN